MEEQVLQIMKQAGKPLKAGEIAELSGLDKKVVEKAMKELQKKDAIFSPIRCQWQARQVMVGWCQIIVFYPII